MLAVTALFEKGGAPLWKTVTCRMNAEWNISDAGTLIDSGAISLLGRNGGAFL